MEIFSITTHCCIAINATTNKETPIHKPTAAISAVNPYPIQSFGKLTRNRDAVINSQFYWYNIRRWHWDHQWRLNLLVWQYQNRRTPSWWFGIKYRLIEQSDDWLGTCATTSKLAFLSDWTSNHHDTGERLFKLIFRRNRWTRCDVLRHNKWEHRHCRRHALRMEKYSAEDKNTNSRKLPKCFLEFSFTFWLATSLELS